MPTTVRYILITALRDWFFLGLCGALVLVFALSYMMGYAMLVEEKMSMLAFFAGASRITLVMGMIVFSCFHVRRAFETKEIEMMLSKPIAREKLVVAYWFAFAAVSMVLTAPVAFLFGALGIEHGKGLAVWLVSLQAEIWIVIAFAIFTSMLLKSSVMPVIATLVFYVMGRMGAYFIATVEAPRFLKADTIMDTVGQYTVYVTTMLLPRLDFFSHSDWVVYGLKNSDDVCRLLIQTAVYVPLVLAAAMVDFRRKQF